MEAQLEQAVCLMKVCLVFDCLCIECGGVIMLHGVVLCD